MLLFLALLALICILAAPVGVIDVTSERLISLAHLARCVPRRRRDRPVSPSTVYRWRRPGIRGIRLECVRVGGCWCTSMAAFRDFCARLSALDDPGVGRAPDPEVGRMPTNDRRRRDRVERELDRELGPERSSSTRTPAAPRLPERPPDETRTE